jgi:hypothetical protein
VNGEKNRTYTTDFPEHGVAMWTEIAGMETPEWKLHGILFDVLYAERDEQVIK